MSAAPRVRVCVLGSLNTDLVVDVPALPSPGQTVTGGSLLRAPGGKGANQAVAARRLGAEVGLVGAVGDDDLGRELLAGLSVEGVDVAHVALLPGLSSGVALIVVEAGGDNTITVAPGANAAVDGGHVTAATDAVVGADVLLLQLEVPTRASLAAAVLARSHGRLVVLNAGPVAAAPDADLERLLATCDAVVVNEDEAAVLHGRGVAVVAALSTTRFVTTLGANGARWSHGDGHGSCPSLPVDAVDAVGAGDTFAAALAVGLAEGLCLAEAVRRGCAAGALATTGRGAQASMPRRDDVDALLTGAPGA